ncbi:MAG: TRAP transporter small permease [Desulfomonile sp.]|nr:TRAP transporter small permease [Desulfomonile sp.]
MQKSNGGFWAKLETVATTLSKVTGLVGAVALFAAALVTTEGVLVRKVLDWSTIWQIEFSVFLLMYACFVGAAFGQLGGHHLNIDLIIIHLKPRTREKVLVVADIATCIVCVVIAIYAWPVWWEAVVRNEHSESLWGPPLWIPYIFLPLGVSLVFLQVITQIHRRIEALRLGTVEEQFIPTELKDIEIAAASHSGPKGEGDE